MKKDTKRGAAVVTALKSESLTSLGKEYLEVGVDALLESGALKDIPLVSTLLGLSNAVGSYKDHLLTAKLLRFLTQLSEIPTEERIAMVDKLNEDSQFFGKTGAALIEILDRMESEKKPELAAKCFAAFAKNEITFEELRRILLALERVPSFDINKLEQFSKVTINESLKMDEALLLAFVNAGLGRNNGGLDGGAIIPTKLCIKFVAIGLAA